MSLLLFLLLFLKSKYEPFTMVVRAIAAWLNFPRDVLIVEEQHKLAPQRRAQKCDIVC
jgi:hypothetical protein